MNACREKNPTVLNLAMDNVNLALCDLRDFFDCPVLIAQTKYIVTFIKEENCSLIALLIA